MAAAEGSSDECEFERNAATDVIQECDSKEVFTGYLYDWADVVARMMVLRREA